MKDYEKLETTSDDESSFIQDRESPQACACSRSSRTRTLLPWIYCALCTAITALSIISPATFHSQAQDSPSASLPKNHPTDFAFIPDIGTVQNYYFNVWDFNPKTHNIEYKEPDPSARLYAGAPSPAIDKSWSELLHGSYMALDDDEAATVQAAAPWELERLNKGKEGKEEGTFYLELDVFHNLHCIDLVRRALNPEYYDIHTDFSQKLPPRWRMGHVYHCIDQLRQAIQCHSDLTPVALFSMVPGINNTYLSHSVTHTCRDFDAIVKWRDERNLVKEPFAYHWK